MNGRSPEASPKRPHRRVAELMRRNFISVAPDDSLLDAYQIMRLARVRYLPVVSDGVLVGLLSFREVVEVPLAGLFESPSRNAVTQLRGARVESVMRQPPRTLPPHALLGVAALELCELDTGFLPVVEPSGAGPRLVGLLTETDLLRAAYDPSSA